MTEVTQVQPAVFRAKDAAAYLGMAESTFWEYVRKGKIGKGLRYSSRCTVWRQKVLDKFLDAIEQEQ